MDKIKALLLPLALIFAAIAVFETGARYGATNMRAYGIASELQLPLNIYVSGQSAMNEQARAQWATIIDNGIAAGALHRQLWYLNKDAKAHLDQMLEFALSVRGNATIEQFEEIANSQERPQGLSDMKLDEIRGAILRTQAEFAGNAAQNDQSASQNEQVAAQTETD
jgi:hypothetical protein